MSFRRGGKKVKFKTMQDKAPASPLLPICAKSTNMLERFTEGEAEQYFAHHIDIIPLYEINLAEQELGRAQKAMEKELAVSKRVKTVQLEELKVSEDGTPWPIMVAKHLPTEFKKEPTQMLKEYKDVFAWFYEDM